MTIRFRATARTPSFLSPSRRTVRCCLKQMNSCVTAPGEHFPAMADHPPLLASSSLGFCIVSRSHFGVRKLERFMRERLVLRRLHLRYLHSPRARLSLLGISWRLRGFLSFCWAPVVCLVEFYGTVLNAREFHLDNYSVCLLLGYLLASDKFFVVIGWESRRSVIINMYFLYSIFLPLYVMPLYPDFVSTVYNGKAVVPNASIHRHHDENPPRDCRPLTAFRDMYLYRF